ncbi:MAG: hypothetical protein LUH53_02440, partial [Lachnospiraceae bacterium]|nr:hypothetical protein [Lachnospiraceae bacterium]
IVTDPTVGNNLNEREVSEMNTNVKTVEKQAESENCVKKSRADYRREKKAAVKAKESKSKNGKVQGSAYGRPNPVYEPASPGVEDLFSGI